MIRHEPHMPAPTPGGLQHRYPTIIELRRLFVLDHIKGARINDDDANYFVGDGTITLDEYRQAKAECKAIQEA